MIRDVNNVIKIPSKLETDFFKYWLEFLKPFHNMSPRECEVIAELLRTRYELSKVVKDPILLEKITLSEEYREKVRHTLGITANHFQVILCKLRKSGVLLDDRINPKFIPNVTEDNSNGSFKLLFIFGL